MTHSDHVVAMETVSEDRDVLADALEVRLLRYSVDHRAIFNDEHTTGTLMALEARQFIVAMRSELLAALEAGEKWRNACSRAEEREETLKEACEQEAGRRHHVEQLLAEKHEIICCLAAPASPSPVLGEPK